MRYADIIDEMTLYRGDASKIDQFDSAKAGDFLLYTPGTYLTDSPDVAADYTLKGSEHVVYQDKEAKDVRELIVHYLGRLITSQSDWSAAKAALKKTYTDKGYDQSKGLPYAQSQEVYKRLQKEWDVEGNKLHGKYLTKAKAIFSKEADALRITRDTTGTWFIVKADRKGHISTFDIPDSYLAKTLHTERALPPAVIAAIRELWFGTIAKTGRDPKTSVFDMRDPDGDFMKFDDWVKAYQKTGVDFAWRDEDDRIVGGKGELPDLETFWHGTHFGGSWFMDKPNMDAFIKAMQGLGYVGLEYDGGKRVGAHVKGGGGILHRAFVFWNDAEINSFRKTADQVQDTQTAAGLEKGARNSQRLRQIVAQVGNNE